MAKPATHPQSNLRDSAKVGNVAVQGIKNRTVEQKSATRKNATFVGHCRSGSISATRFLSLA